MVNQEVDHKIELEQLRSRKVAVMATLRQIVARIEELEESEPSTGPPKEQPKVLKPFRLRREPGRKGPSIEQPAA